MTDFRALCEELANELDNIWQCLMDNRRLLHPLANEARAALAEQPVGAVMTNLSAAAQAVLCAYRDFSWTPDEENNGKYYKFCHKAGMAAALRAVADQVVPEVLLLGSDYQEIALQEARKAILAIADELERQ
jgi:hypothetical protein